MGHNSWEPATNLPRCAEIVETFHAAHPAAPHQLAASLFSTLPWQPRSTCTDPATLATTYPTWELGVHDRPLRTSVVRGGVM
jgi:hypothetical protein